MEVLLPQHLEKKNYYNNDHDKNKMKKENIDSTEKEDKIKEAYIISDYFNSLAKKQNLDFYSMNYDDRDIVLIKCNKEKTDVDYKISNGIGIRIINKGKQGFSYTEDLSKKGIKQALENSIKASKLNPNKIDFCCQKTKKVRIINKYKESTIDEKTKRAEETLKIFDKKNFVNNIFLSKKITTLFTSSEGREILQHKPYSAFVSRVTLKKGNRIEEGYHQYGRQQGFEINKKFESVVKKAYKNANFLMKAYIPKGGKYNIVTNGVLTGVMIHEALGHASEADLVLRKESCLRGKLNQKIAPNYITVHDNPTIKNQWGSYYYDDEGIKSKDVKIIENGILKNYLHSRETSSIMKQRLNGHARSEDSSFLPIVRMSNTYLEKRDMSNEELFETVKNGFFLINSLGGQVNTLDGNYLFNSKYGYEIKNGKLTRIVKNVSLSSNILKSLNDIIGIGKKYEDNMPGTCGKSGQGVPVSGNNPRIAIKNVILGGK